MYLYTLYNVPQEKDRRCSIQGEKKKRKKKKPYDSASGFLELVSTQVTPISSELTPSAGKRNGASEN